MTPFEQIRIAQLISPYAPDDPPSLPLDFGDYLSLLWRLDRANHDSRARYYRRCVQSLSVALGLEGQELGRLVRTTPPGEIYAALEHLPYRLTERVIDAADRRAAIHELLSMRSEVLQLGTVGQEWATTWPGSRILDDELRDRVFAVLFTALPSQYPPFARLLLVIDIVLQELLIGTRRSATFLMHTLVRDFDYPDPATSETRQLYARA